MKEKMSVKTIVAIGIGSAVFVILGRFVVIPTGIPNTNLETSYPFLALMSVVFGPVAGGLIGLIGHTLKILPRMVALGGAGLFVQELLVLFLASLVVKWIFNMVNLQQMTWCVSIFSKPLAISSFGA